MSGSESVDRVPQVRLFERILGVERGNGIVSKELVGTEQGARQFISGCTTLPVGAGIPKHLHNCDEQVTVLQGRATVEIEDQRHAVQPFDTTFVPGGLWHRFVNAGDCPLVILWVYGGLQVTRTFADSGKTVNHLSEADQT